MPFSFIAGRQPLLLLFLFLYFLLPAIAFMPRGGERLTFRPAIDTVKPAAKGRITNGVNLQPNYTAYGNVDLGWSLMKQHPRIRTVRLQIEPDQVTNAKRWIREAAAHGYTVIATYHKATVAGSNDPAWLQEAAGWWQLNYGQLRASGDFMINLMNEWGNHNLTAQEYATAYNAAIARVRTVYQGKIIIDLPGWGQEAWVAANAVKGVASGGVKIADTAIVLSAHIYPGALVQQRTLAGGAKGTPGWMTVADLEYLGSCGRPCMVGEFGSGTAGGADWHALVAYASSRSWPVLGWAWGGDGGQMNMIAPQFQPLQPGQPYPYTRSDYFNMVYDKL
ncbi:cellulase family glycosylhydrolase [Paraflavisolibacter sp. H34]|uniref:cellulase family glycosylhydrolase n=1 Tax=Huijunlia imazamoxiresistens TaxID=3127457 RepID=UPI003017B2AA